MNEGRMNEEQETEEKIYLNLPGMDPVQVTQAFITERQLVGPPGSHWPWWAGKLQESTGGR